jgi:hypothetical protein
MRQSYSGIDELRNCLASQALVIAMEIERHHMSRPDGRMSRSISWNELPPAQAGLAAALRRAFTVPADETERQFDDLLSKLC